MHELSWRARVLRLRGAVRRLAFIATVHVAFAVRYQLGAPNFFFHSSITRPASAPCLRFASRLAARHARLGVRMGRYSFPVRLFHPLLHAGFDRRTTNPFRVSGAAKGIESAALRSPRIGEMSGDGFAGMKIGE